MRRSSPRILIALLLLVPAFVAADEGMWMPHQLGTLDTAALRQLGLELAADDIWNASKGTGLAAATPWLGGCSSSFVSPDGLIVTNHHCAYRAIQQNSSAERDYITNGFMAATRAEELQARGSRVTVFRGYDDVTASMREVLKDGMSAEERVRAIESRQKELVAACEKDGLTCRVAEMFGGGAYYLYRGLELRDVRLVYAPARGIGEYGGEVDNWQWPRHTGDFTFLRAYVGPDGAPADYSADNVPFRPERWLKVASTPVRPGDFTMIIGYPGRTYRYRISAAVADDAEFYYPRRIQILADLIAILEEQGKRSREVEITLASAIKGYNNSIKNNRGMLEGLRGADLAGRKRAEEAELGRWIEAAPERRARYGGVIAKLEALNAEKRATRERDLVLGWLPPGRASSLLSAAALINRWAEERAKPEAERAIGYLPRDERNARQRLERMQRDLDLPTDRAVLRYALRLAVGLPEGQRLAALDKVLAATGAKGEAAVDALLERLYAGTTLADPKARMTMFDMPSDQIAAHADPMLELARALRTEEKQAEQGEDRREGESLMLFPRYIQALSEYRGKPLYPDANSTLRFTYATVKGYQPRDGVFYLPFTTLAGLVAKDTGEEPFDSPKALLQAAKGDPKRFAPYYDEQLGDVPPCFLSTNDITGGNSGSPIMNGRGELIGLAFDGNYEWMTTDYEFSNALSRTINVDMRFVLWVMDHVDRAHHLMREIGVQPQAK